MATSSCSTMSRSAAVRSMDSKPRSEGAHLVRGPRRHRWPRANRTARTSASSPCTSRLYMPVPSPSCLAVAIAATWLTLDGWWRRLAVTGTADFCWPPAGTFSWPWTKFQLLKLKCSPRRTMRRRQGLSEERIGATVSTERLESAIMARRSPELRAELVHLLREAPCREVSGWCQGETPCDDCRVDAVLDVVMRECRAGAWTGATAALVDKPAPSLHGHECDDYGPGL